MANVVGTLVTVGTLPISRTESLLSSLISQGPAPGMAATMAGEILRTGIASGKAYTDQEKREFLVKFSRSGVTEDTFLAALTKEKGLTSLFPNLGVQKDIEAMIADNKSVDSILKWIEV